MTKSVRVVEPDVDAERAWQRLRGDRVHHLVVMDGKRVIGVISEVELGGAGGAAVRRGRTVRDLMRAQVVTIEPDDTVRRAANLMRGNDVSCVPVMLSGKLIGVLTTTDMLDMIGRGMEQTPREAERWTLHSRGQRKSMVRRALKAATKFGRQVGH